MHRTSGAPHMCSGKVKAEMVACVSKRASFTYACIGTSVSVFGGRACGWLLAHGFPRGVAVDFRIAGEEARPQETRGAGEVPQPSARGQSMGTYMGV